MKLFLLKKITKPVWKMLFEAIIGAILFSTIMYLVLSSKDVTNLVSKLQERGNKAILEVCLITLPVVIIVFVMVKLGKNVMLKDNNKK